MWILRGHFIFSQQQLGGPEIWKMCANSKFLGGATTLLCLLFLLLRGRGHEKLIIADQSMGFGKYIN
jgi:hypothetical protein